jgi:unsaturated rhamnogalacturonyl hydrolase
VFIARAIVALALLAWGNASATERLNIGLTRTGQTIRAVVLSAPQLPKIVLIGGFDGVASASIQAQVRKIEAIPQAKRRFHLIAIPLANPDRSRMIFPPVGTAYRDNPESHYLWRWIALQAPDLVLIDGAQDYGLAEALSHNAVAGFGRIPAHSFTGAFPKSIVKSEARVEAARRLTRSPRQLADELALIYGHDLNQPVYIPAMALIARLRLGGLADVESLASPYVSGGKNSLAGVGSTHLAGHLIFAELAARTGNPAYTALMRAAADLGFTALGEMKESMPFHDQMSDAVFMSCPLLASAGKLTGNRIYFDMALRHLRFMQALCLRADGLYRHSPLNDAAWGRGNAFPALGLAMALSNIPADHPAHAEMLLAFQAHLAALARYQGDDGMWREVIDRPGVYEELSATAMILAAMVRGVRSGWLGAKSYDRHIQAAWHAIALRTGRDGELIDVCESTGKQNNADDYLYRAASLGPDARGGAMVLFAATEMCCSQQ